MSYEEWLHGQAETESNYGQYLVATKQFRAARGQLADQATRDVVRAAQFDPNAALWRQQGSAGRPGDPSYVHVNAPGVVSVGINNRAIIIDGDSELPRLQNAQVAGYVRGGVVVVSDVDGRAHVIGNEHKSQSNGIDGDSQELRIQEEADGEVESDDDYVESLYE